MGADFDGDWRLRDANPGCNACVFLSPLPPSGPYFPAGFFLGAAAAVTDDEGRRIANDAE